MAAEKIIEVKFTGNDILPENVRARELAEILTDVEGMIASVVNREYPHLQKEDIVVGLVNVERGSVNLQFAPQLPAVVIPAFESIAYALTDNTYLTLPESAIESLQRLSSFSRRNRCLIELKTRNGNERLLATITPETVIESLPALYGETILFGFVIRIGGRTPRVMLELPSGETVSCSIEENLARRLAYKLYSWVGLRGTAKWNSKNYFVEEFHVEEITSFDEKPVTETLSELSTSISRYFNDIYDVIGYVSSLRNEQWEE